MKLRYKIDPGFQNLIIPLKPKERELLERSILQDGIQHPITVWKEQNVLIDGHHRHFIWLANQTKVKLPTIRQLSFKTRDEAELWMLENQSARRNLDMDDLVCLQADAADRRMRIEYAKAGKPVPKDLTLAAAADDATEIALRSQEGYLGKVVQQNALISDRALRMAWELRRDNPGLFAKVKAHEATLRGAYAEHLNQQQAKELDRTAKKPVRAVDGKYDVIVTDPPWPVLGNFNNVKDRSVKPQPYLTMTLDEIEIALEKLFRENTKPDCHIFLWTTQTYLRAALQMIERWNKLLKYACCFVWKKNDGIQPFGFPKYNAEFILYLRRGEPKFIDTKNFWACFEADKQYGKHSAKPEEFYATLRRVTSGLRLDHFNRRRIEGFVGWGNESPKAVKLKDQPAPSVKKLEQQIAAENAAKGFKS